MALVGFGQLPEEEPEFLAYLQKTGDIWARDSNDHPREPKCEPLPLLEFIKTYENHADLSHLYLGFEEHILHPAIHVGERLIGGTRVPFVQAGEVVKGAFTIVGGNKVATFSVDTFLTPIMWYQRPRFYNENELESTHLGFYPGGWNDKAWIAHPETFMKWGKKVLAWARRHSPEKVRVCRCNYDMRATIATAAACKNGLNLLG